MRGCTPNSIKLTGNFKQTVTGLINCNLQLIIFNNPLLSTNRLEAGGVLKSMSPELIEEGQNGRQ